MIKKQRIDIRLNPRMDSFRIQQKLSDQYWKFLVPLLEQAFDQLAADQEVICLKNLEIDMGIIKESDIDRLSSDPELISSIKRQIHDHIASELSAGKTAVTRSAVANSFHQWLFYMRHGYLDWNVSFLNDQWYNQVLEALATEDQHVFLLKQAIKENDSLLTRLIRQHPEEFLLHLIDIFAAQKQIQLRSKLTGLHQQLKQLTLDDEMAGPAGYETFWRQVFRICASTQGKNISRELAGLTGSPDSRTPAAEPTKTAISTQAELPAEDAQGAAAHLYLQDAGLVLIHPFLNSLFNRLGLLDGKHFINTQAREKAIYLLFYAARGKTLAKEYELVIPKMLCGHALALPVPADITVSDLETAEVDAMLQAAISNWDLLKNTSADGLRAGFLQRAGRVLISSEKLNFQVEKSGIDLLLDHLPWSLSMIKLPWLNQIIYVEWR